MSKSEEIRDVIGILSLMIKQYEKRGGGYSQKEALNFSIKHLQDYLRIAGSGMPKEKEIKGNVEAGLEDEFEEKMAYNQAFHDCTIFFQHNFSVEKIEKILYDTKIKWDDLDDYEKVSLPKAGIKLYAEEIYKAITKGMEK